jgi:hypothetical protein
MSSTSKLPIRRYIEWWSRGRLTGRVAYVTREFDMPSPRPGAEWHPDRGFDAATELKLKPDLKEVFRAAIRAGAQTVEGQPWQRGPASRVGG